MRKLLMSIRMNKIPIIIAFVHWALLMVFHVDQNFFLYGLHVKTAKIGLLSLAVKSVSEILTLCLLEFIWITVFRLCKAWKQKDLFAKRFVHIWGLYSSILCVIMLILWPGTWSWDDILELAGVQYYLVNPWQHIISSFEQMVLLEIIPLPAGYVILKNFLIAGIVAYVICKVENTWQIRLVFKRHYWLDIFIKLIPFLLPPVLMYQFSGYRIGLYVYLELLMLIVMICSLKNNYQWTNFRVIMFAVLISICACWRSESLFYIFLGIAFFVVGKNSTLKRKMRIGGIVCTLLCFVILSFSQSMALKLAQKGNNYEIMSTMRPAVELIRHADTNKDVEILARIDKVVNVEIVKEHPDHNGEIVYWYDNAVRKSYTKQEYKDYIKAFVQLSLRYPMVVWQERVDVFSATSGFEGDRQYKNIETSIDMLNPDKTQYQKVFTKIVTDYKYPIFPELRTRFIHFIGMKHHGELIQPFHAIEWNIIVPMLILLVAFVKLLYQKKWMYAVILAFVLVKMPVVFLTAPSTWFMYYLSFYFLGYVLLDFYLVYRIGERRKVSDNER